MLIGQGITTLEFHEPSLCAPVPECAAFLAAACWQGYRLLSDGSVNHEDVIVGVDRLQRFKDAKRAKLSRLIRLHFAAASLPVCGITLRVDEFRAFYDSDATYRAWVARQQHFEAWHDLAREQLRSARRAVVAIEGPRITYGALGGIPAKLAAFAGFHENGIH